MKTKSLFFILLVVISILPLFDLFHAGLPITHDGQDHVARIANFYQNLKEGTFIPRWAGNLNWGYGHPILMFLYPFSSYTTSLFHFVGFSLVDSIKIVFAVAFIASGLTMYLFMRKAFGEEAGFVSALLYLFAPYRFVDLYVRGAIGEHVAFIFPPLICYFLLCLAKRNSPLFVLGGSLALASLILSHNAITLMFLPIIALYVLYLILTNKSKRLIYQYTSIIVFGFGISAFFWMPAFFEGKYTLRDIVTKGEYALRFVQFKDLLFGPWSFGGSGQFTVQIGALQWITLIMLLPIIFFLKKKKNKLWLLCAGFFIIFLSAIFLMTSYSHLVWEKITTLQKFQFPWRFLSVTVFVTAFFGGIVIATVRNKYKMLIVVLMVFFSLWLAKDYWHANGYLFKPESFYSGIYNGTTDTGESAPIWSIRFMEYPPKAAIEVITGQAQLSEKKRTVTHHLYDVNVVKKARIRENTLFFPGWRVFVDNQPVVLEFQDPLNRGLMTFFVEEGRHRIDVRFSETKLRLIADAISVFNLVIIGFYGILRKLQIWHRFRLY